MEQMTDKERFEYAERIMACRNEDGFIDEVALKALADEKEVADEDQAAILNIVQDLMNHDAPENDSETFGFKAEVN